MPKHGGTLSWRPPSLRSRILVTVGSTASTALLTQLHRQSQQGRLRGRAVPAVWLMHGSWPGRLSGGSRCSVARDAGGRRSVSGSAGWSAAVLRGGCLLLASVVRCGPACHGVASSAHADAGVPPFGGTPNFKASRSNSGGGSPLRRAVDNRQSLWIADLPSTGRACYWAVSTSRPPRYGRNAAGTRTEPSAC